MRSNTYSVTFFGRNRFYKQILKPFYVSAVLFRRKKIQTGTSLLPLMFIQFFTCWLFTVRVCPGRSGKQQDMYKGPILPRYSELADDAPGSESSLGKRNLSWAAGRLAFNYFYHGVTSFSSCKVIPNGSSTTLVIPHPLLSESKGCCEN